ncbi:MAG: hypothetical protein Q9224_002639, partial [Gallowayella concinna]
ILMSSVALAFSATVNSQATSTNEPAVEASDIEAVIPTEIISPAQATSIAAVADTFIASVTAAPEYSSVLSVLATGIPITAQVDIAKNPEQFLLNLLSGSPPPAWATALPPSVAEYVESVGEAAAQLVTSDFPDLYTSLSAEAAALETGASGSGPFILPTGGYQGSNYTNPRPTGSAAGPGSTPEPFVPGSGASVNAKGFTLAVVAAGFGDDTRLVVVLGSQQGQCLKSLQALRLQANPELLCVRAILGLATNNSRYRSLAHNQTIATTLQPVFVLPPDATKTVYANTATVHSAVDCSGSSLVVSTYSRMMAKVPKITATVTSSATTSTAFACQSSVTTTSSSISESVPFISPPTAVPSPVINGTAQTLIDELRTASLYVSLIGNGGNFAKLCSALNPAALFNETGINGTAVQTEVCSAAAIAQFFPETVQAIVLSNQVGFLYLQTALFAVQAVSHISRKIRELIDTAFRYEASRNTQKQISYCLLFRTFDQIKKKIHIDTHSLPISHSRHLHRSILVRSNPTVTGSFKPPTTAMGQAMSVVRKDLPTADILATLASVEGAYPNEMIWQSGATLGFFVGPPLVGLACQYLATTKDTTVGDAAQQSSPANPPARNSATATSDAQTQTDEGVNQPLATPAATSVEGRRERSYFTAPPSPVHPDDASDDEHFNRLAVETSEHDDGRTDHCGVQVSRHDETDSSASMTAALLEPLYTTINRLQEKLDQQTMTIDGLNTNIDQQRARMSQQDRTIQEMAQTIDGQKTSMSQQDKNIQEMAQTIDEQSTTTNQQEETIQEMARTIDEQRTTTSQQDGTIQEMAQTINEQKNQIEQSKTSQNPREITLEMNANRMSRRADRKKQTVEATAVSTSQPKANGKQHLDCEGVMTTTTEAELEVHAVEPDQAKEDAIDGKCNEDDLSELDEVPLALIQTSVPRRPTVVQDVLGLRGAFMIRTYKEKLEAEKAGRKADAEKAEAELAKEKSDCESAIANSKMQWTTEKDDLIAKHQSETSEMDNAHRTTTEKLEKDVQVLKAKVVELTNDQVMKSEEVTDLTTKLEDMKLEMSAQHATLKNKHRQELITKQGRLESQQLSMSVLQKAATSQLATTEELRKSNGTKDSENHTLQAENKTLKSQIARWKSRFDASKQSKQIEAAEKDAEIEKLEADIEKGKAENLRLICCIPLPNSRLSSTSKEKLSSETISSSKPPSPTNPSSTAESTKTITSTAKSTESILDTDVPLEVSCSGEASAISGKGTPSIEDGPISSNVDEPTSLPSLPISVPEAVESKPQDEKTKISRLSSALGENIIAENTEEVPEQLQQHSSTPTDIVILPSDQSAPETTLADITPEVPAALANDLNPQTSSGRPSPESAKSDTVTEASIGETPACLGNIPKIIVNVPPKEQSDGPEVDKCGNQHMAEGPSVQESPINAGTLFPSVQDTSNGKQLEVVNEINDQPMEELPHHTGDPTYNEVEAAAQQPMLSSDSNSLPVPTHVVENNDRDMNDAEPMNSTPMQPARFSLETTCPPNDTLVPEPDTLNEHQMEDEPQVPGPAVSQQIDHGQPFAGPFSFDQAFPGSNLALPTFTGFQPLTYTEPSQLPTNAPGSQTLEEPMGDAAESNLTNPVNNFAGPSVPVAPQFQFGEGIGGPKISFPNINDNPIQVPQTLSLFNFDQAQPGPQQPMMDFEHSNSSGNNQSSFQYTVDNTMLNSATNQLCLQMAEQNREHNQESQYPDPDPTNLFGQQYNIQPWQGLGVADDQLSLQGPISNDTQVGNGRAKSSRPQIRARRNRPRPYNGFPTQVVDPAQQFPAPSMDPIFSSFSTTSNSNVQPSSWSMPAHSFNSQNTPDGLIDPLLRDLKPEEMISTCTVPEPATQPIYGDGMVQGYSNTHMGEPQSRQQPGTLLESPASPTEPDAQSATYADEAMSETDDVTKALAKEMEEHRLEDEAEEAEAEAAAAKAAGATGTEMEGAHLFEWFQQEVAKPSSTVE